ncbi:MAG: HemY protein [Pseudohongiellaceae bacterium]|jgi:HemY protein
MIKLFVFSLLAIVLAVLVNLYTGFPTDPGYLMLAFGNYTFETSLFAMLIALGIIYLILRLLLVLLYALNPLNLLSIGKVFKSERKTRRRTKSVEGFLAFARRDWSTAYGLLIRGAKQTEDNLANYLAAAFAAHKLGDREAWTKALESAEEHYPTAHGTIQSVKAQLLFKSNQLEQCLAVLEQIKNGPLNDPASADLLRQVYIRLEEWDKLSELVPILEKKKLVEADELEQLKLRIFMEQLYGLFNAADENKDSESTLEELRRRWKKAPSKYKEDAKVVKHYANLLQRLGVNTDAAKVIENALDKHWNSDLALEYGATDYGVNQQQLLTAEAWLKQRPANSELMLSLGRICLRNQLWGKAREYYTASLKISPTAQAHGELSMLLRSLGETAQGDAHFKSYTDLTGSNLLDLPMPKLADI